MYTAILTDTPITQCFHSTNSMNSYGEGGPWAEWLGRIPCGCVHVVKTALFSINNETKELWTLKASNDAQPPKMLNWDEVTQSDWHFAGSQFQLPNCQTSVFGSSWLLLPLGCFTAALLNILMALKDETDWSRTTWQDFITSLIWMEVLWP